MAAEVQIVFNRFPELTEKFFNGAASIVAATSGAITYAAKAAVHNVSGEMDAGIHVHAIGPLDHYVVSEARYSAFVEYGTATRGRPAPSLGSDFYTPGPAYNIFPLRPAYALHFFWKGQEWFRSAVYNHPGIYSHPFMTPAAEGARLGFIAAFSNLERFLR